MKKKNEIGNRYGKLVVLEEHSKTHNGHIKYKCQCDCGQESIVFATHLRRGNTKSCGCSMITKGDKHINWSGVGDISSAFWSTHIIHSASGNKGKRKKLELTITKQYAWDLFIKQNRKCALSGIELHFPATCSDKTWTASLDRIDSSKGYIEGNVQWVHKHINMMKRFYSQEYFIEMCKAVTKNAGGGCEIDFNELQPGI